MNAIDDVHFENDLCGVLAATQTGNCLELKPNMSHVQRIQQVVEVVKSFWGSIVRFQQE